MKQYILTIIFLLTINFTYGQKFHSLTNLEELFTKSKIQVDSIIKESYDLKSKDSKKGIMTYEYIFNKGMYNEFQYFVNVIFKGNRLTSISWNDMIPQGAFIVKDIQDANYKMIENKTDDQLGYYYLQCPYKNLDVIIFRTAANTSKRMISFHLFERPKIK